jgi:hypothetical protein
VSVYVCIIYVYMCPYINGKYELRSQVIFLRADNNFMRFMSFENVNVVKVVKYAYNVNLVSVLLRVRNNKIWIQ